LLGCAVLAPDNRIVELCVDCRSKAADYLEASCVDIVQAVVTPEGFDGNFDS
jgi:hypothetical protein